VSEKAVQQITAALNRGDIDAVSSRFADDAVADWTHSRGPWAGTYQGVEEILRIWRENFVDLWGSCAVELEQVEELGNGVVVSQNLLQARGAGSGIEVEARAGSVWWFEDEKVVRWQMFQSWEEARQAAAVDEG
jgi:ketosteroid isomerase-like protein